MIDRALIQAENSKLSETINNSLLEYASINGVSISILNADTEEQKVFRVKLSKATSQVIKTAFGLLGIDVPDRM